jgi:hypothetical protein
LGVGRGGIDRLHAGFDGFVAQFRTFSPVGDEARESNYDSTQRSTARHHSRGMNTQFSLLTIITERRGVLHESWGVAGNTQETASGSPQ